MTILRATAVLKHVSGFARDNAVNTFHFEGDNDEAARSTIIGAVRDFYTAQDAGNPNGSAALGVYLAPAYRTLDVHVYEVPGTLQPNGRETPSGPPVASFLGTPDELVAMNGGSTPLPAEVAICVSYQGTPGPGLVQSRRRGRIYFGPLNTAASTNVGGVARPAANVRTQLGDRYNRLLQAVDGQVEAVVYSRPFAGRVGAVKDNGEPKPDLPPRAAFTVGIDQLWVDDEFDTQRRRGLQRTGRTLVSALG